jgi:hypothetical protein
MYTKISTNGIKEFKVFDHSILERETSFLLLFISALRVKNYNCESKIHQMNNDWRVLI